MAAESFSPMPGSSRKRTLGDRGRSLDLRRRGGARSRQKQQAQSEEQTEQRRKGQGQSAGETLFPLHRFQVLGLRSTRMG